MTTSKSRSCSSVVTERENKGECCWVFTAVPLLCRVAGCRCKDSLTESEQEGGKGGEGRNTQLALF